MNSVDRVIHHEFTLTERGGGEERYTGGKSGRMEVDHSALSLSVKGIIQPKLKLKSFTHLHGVPNLPV